MRRAHSVLRSVSRLPRVSVAAAALLYAALGVALGIVAVRSVLSASGTGALGSRFPGVALFLAPVSALLLWFSYRALRYRRRVVTDMLYRRGLAAVRAGNTNEATRHLRESLTNDTSFWRARYQLGRVALDARRYETARDQFLAGLEVAPRETTLLLGLALAYEELGDLERVRDALKRLLEIEPSHADAVCLLGCLSEREGEVTAAVGLYDQALSLNPRHPAALANRRRLAKAALGSNEKADTAPPGRSKLTGAASVD